MREVIFTVGGRFRASKPNENEEKRRANGTHIHLCSCFDKSRLIVRLTFLKLWVAPSRAKAVYTTT